MKFVWPFVSRKRYEELEGRVEYLEWVVDQRNRTIEIYRKNLAKAQRNDTPRDPKTGKFVRR